METIWSINHEAVKDMLPDLVIGMDMPVEIGYERTYDADGDKRERKQLLFFDTVDEGYRLIAQDPRIADRRSWVDATGSIDDVFDRIVQVLEDKKLIHG
jgi:dTMP kinase